jgi:hypothetical protein
VTGFVIRANGLGNTPSPVGTGVYTVTSGTPTLDTQGNVLIASASASRNDATCGHVRPRRPRRPARSRSTW